MSFPMHGKSYKIIQSHFKISSMSCMRTGLALTHTHHLYVLSKPHTESYPNQEVDGCPGEGNLTGGS